MRGTLIAVAATGVFALAGATGWMPSALTGEARALTNCDTGTAALDAAETQVLTLVNNHRVAAGLGTLAPSPALSRAAAWKSEDRATSWGPGLSHTDRLGRNASMRGGECGYPGWVGENIAYGYPTGASVVEAWMGSAGHRANILNGSYTVAGVGHSDGAWTMDFGVVNDGGAATSPSATNAATATSTPRSVTNTPPPPATATPVPAQTPTPGPAEALEPAVARGPIVMELRAGMNLVTYAGEREPANVALSELGGLVETLWSWNGDTGQWDAWSWGDGSPSMLQPGQAYFMRLKDSTTWSYQAAESVSTTAGTP